MRLRSVLLLGAFCVPGILAADFCSLSVRVLTAGQRRPLEVPVIVQEPSGRVVERETDRNDAQFCDLGISSVTVTVGIAGCNQVVVRDVPLRWEEPYLLTVTYDIEPCLREGSSVPIPTCEVLFRVADQNGSWIQDAGISFSGPQLKTRRTDRFGRAFIELKVGDSINSSKVEAIGFQSQVLTGISCQRKENPREISIRLEAKN